jgi:hypothetical protein
MLTTDVNERFWKSLRVEPGRTRRCTAQFLPGRTAEPAQGVGQLSRD